MKPRYQGLAILHLIQFHFTTTWTNESHVLGCFQIRISHYWDYSQKYFVQTRLEYTLTYYLWKRIDSELWIRLFHLGLLVHGATASLRLKILQTSIPQCYQEIIINSSSLELWLLGQSLLRYWIWLCQYYYSCEFVLFLY